MKKKISIFSPISSTDNKYVEIITSMLRESGYERFKLSSLMNFSVISKCKVIHLNWYENIYDRNKFSATISFLKKFSILCIIKLFRMKLMWTMHNKQQHDSNNKTYSSLIFNLLVKWSDIIIVHSQISKDILIKQYPRIGEKIIKKIQHIPHPNYINSYGKIVSEQKKSNSLLEILFIGKIKPYKNIELLIDVVKSINSDNIHLKIAGDIISNDYKLKLENRINGYKNISLEPKFIPDDYIPNLLSTCDLLVLPYDISSSLNSGTVILAFSYSKTVICPEIGTIMDFKNRDNILTYSYSSKDEHFQQLYEKISEAILLKEQDEFIFNKMGENMYKQVLEQNNYEYIKNTLNEIYSG